MEQIVLIPFNGEILVLTLDELGKARERGRELLPPTEAVSAKDDRIVDCTEAARLTGVPASWFEQAIREGRIPHLQFGKYKRLRLSEVYEVCETQRRQGDTISSRPNLRQSGKGKS